MPDLPSRPSEPDAEGLKAARMVAQWELGYPSWADRIIGAYLNPQAAIARIEQERNSHVVS